MSVWDWDDALDTACNRELDDTCATEVMRWPVLETNCFDHPETFQARLPRGKTLQDVALPAKQWRPTRRWGDTGILLKHMMSLGLLVEITAEPEESAAQVMTRTGPGLAMGYGDESVDKRPQRAIVKACIRHVREHAQELAEQAAKRAAN